MAEETSLEDASKAMREAMRKTLQKVVKDIHRAIG